VIWQVEEHPSVDKSLAKIPSQVVLKYQFWLDMMQYHGPVAVMKWRGFRDEKLKGEWFGYRASRLNRQYRVIYRIERKMVRVFVEKVDAHTYR